MIIKVNKPRFRSQVAFFDFDWTLVCPKDGHMFPKNISDWQWWRPSVPNIIKSYYEKGFGIYIVTNQSKKWKEEQIREAIALLEIPVTICIAWEKENYKPSLFLYDEAFTHEQQVKFKKNKSFMCGDALGRPNDHSDCDKKFAEALGIKCFSPEEIFPVVKQLQDEPKIKAATSQEIIVMVGYPGSGKTTVSNDTFKKAGYFVAHGDDFKTSAKMIKAAKTSIQEGKSVVFDATNPTIEKRKEYIDFAIAHKIAVRCIWVATTFEESLVRNNAREKPVPKIVFNVYRKRFQEPTKEEGFGDVVIV